MSLNSVLYFFLTVHFKMGTSTSCECHLNKENTGSNLSVHQQTNRQSRCNTNTHTEECSSVTKEEENSVVCKNMGGLGRCRAQ